MRGRLRGSGVISPACVQDPADRRRRRRPQPLPFEVPADRHRPRVQPVARSAAIAARSPARGRPRGSRCGVVFGTAGARLERVQPSFPVAGEKAMQMPAGEPVLGSSRGDRQLLGNDLKNSNTSTRHARDCQPTPGQARAGDRRSGTRPPLAPPRRPPAAPTRCDLCPDS